MDWAEFIGPTYNSRSGDIGLDRCINLYPEQEPSSTKPRALLNTPGLTVVTAGSTPIRGMHYIAGGPLFTVVGSNLCITTSLTPISGATLSTSSGRVSIIDNGPPATSGGNQLLICDGTYAYIYNVVTQTFTSNVLGYAADMAVYIQGFFVANSKTLPYISEAFQVSNMNNGLTWQQTGQCFANPDGLLALQACNQLLYLFGTNTVEVWYNTGAGNSPFAPVQGVLIEQGLSAQWSTAKDRDGILYGLFGGNAGTVYASSINGYTPTRISNPALEYQWAQYSTVVDAYGYCYSMEGHDFYVLTFPTGNATWVYDKTTQMWHERSASFSASMPVSTVRHVGDCYEYAVRSPYYDGIHYLADHTGNLCTMSNTVFTDNGGSITRLRVTPHITNDRKNIFINKLEISMQQTSSANSSLVPSCNLQWSKDQGNTWSSQYAQNMGAVSSYQNRAIWRPLGRSRDRVFAWSTSSPYQVVVTGAEIDYEVTT